MKWSTFLYYTDFAQKYGNSFSIIRKCESPCAAFAQWFTKHLGILLALQNIVKAQKGLLCIMTSSSEYCSEGDHEKRKKKNKNLGIPKQESKQHKRMKKILTFINDEYCTWQHS